MRLVVGLGNPGKRYENNRHNIGFVILDELKTAISNSEFLNPNQVPNPKYQLSKNAKALYLSFKVGEETIKLIKPQTFMNDSGFSVAYAKNKHKIPTDSIYVIHDDLDIKLGEHKIQKGKGPREHNGLLSIYEKLGTRDFWHVRVGIDNPATRNSSSLSDSAELIVEVFRAEGTQHATRLTGEEYVLQNFTDTELSVLDNIIPKVVEDIQSRMIN